MTKMAEMDQKPIFLETSDLVRLADHPNVRLCSPDTRTHVVNLPSYKDAKMDHKNSDLPFNPIIPLAHRFWRHNTCDSRLDNCCTVVTEIEIAHLGDGSLIPTR